ncbi:RNA polymerase sigma factor [Anaerococcus nagyae]|uniref:RNA polymerase sigma factor n=1 Tax=Anaerococcus nagyae TaxID=1755241 RepID=UPI0037367AAD
MKISLENSKQVMDAYMPLIIANARKFSALDYEEVVDESRIILIDAILEYDDSKGTFGNYLKQKLYYHFLDECKKEQISSLDDFDKEGTPLIDSLKDDYDLEKDLEDRQKYKELYEAIENLPDDLRKIIVGKYFLAMTNDELATKTGLSYKTVANKASIALKILRENL